jgi:hypothetical protein
MANATSQTKRASAHLLASRFARRVIVHAATWSGQADSPFCFFRRWETMTKKISALLKILCHHIHLRGAVQGRSKALFGLTSHCIVGQPVVKCGLQSMSLISLECISTWRQLMVHAASYPGIVMRCCLSVLLSRWPPNAQSLVEADGGQRQQLCCALSSDLSVTAKHRIDLGLIGAGRVLQSVNQT